ncbi:hypothetical protein [Brasilonema sp. UFV-L1]|uniref:hypothetical protein n=1 Tax=Brasilonema sp. UFV-L1 TaxID=2234130 RepID=UPI00145FC25A|nr:hypothetical protein [Brasilonema sp. UFV-L1]
MASKDGIGYKKNIQSSEVSNKNQKLSCSYGNQQRASFTKPLQAKGFSTNFLGTYQ